MPKQPSLATRRSFILCLASLAAVLLACKLLAPAATPTPTFTSLASAPVPTQSPPEPTPLQAAPGTTPAPQPTQTVNPSPLARPWPDTTQGIHVFNDQLVPWMSAAQYRFAATHYAGTQKMTRSDAERLRALNPDFLILHYRLGGALGYRAIQGGCQPTGGWLEIIEGDQWVREWPGETALSENWFFHWPQAGRQRLLNCDWGWYQAELDDPAWRDYWQAEVLRQVQANAADGVFMDSLSVPNFLGAERFSPRLPPVDAAFESAWSERIARWLEWLQGQPLGDYLLIPNVGGWITTRDLTDYRAADGVMIEGFALETDGSPLDPEDWRLQMDRALSFTRQGKALIAQVAGVVEPQPRLFALGSYLLIKGEHTFINIELDLEPEWWPEYEIPIGAPTHSAMDSIDDLYQPVGKGGSETRPYIYRRDFSNGFVLVNPGPRTLQVDLERAAYLAQPEGGGALPADGVPTGALSYTAVTQISLPPVSALILLDESP
ncbi:MAG: putative glycoside hydrolase [Chloroflexota bacterium]